MAKFLSRVSLQKTHMRIKLDLVKAISTGKADDSFIVAWKRGPQTDISKKFTLNPHYREVDLGFSFERISTFYSNKKGVIQTKTCELKLMNTKQKVQQSITIDMANHIGNLGIEHEFTFSKQGVTVVVVFDIVPACKIKHAHLFKEENIEVEASVANSVASQNMISTQKREIDSTADDSKEQMQMLQEINQELENANNALKDDNQEHLMVIQQLNEEKIALN